MSNPRPTKCAACKHLRRRCGPGCILAPYFPHDRPGALEQFLNVHKLYGATFMANTIKNAPPQKRKAAAKAIIQESDLFAKNPGGWVRIATELERSVEEKEYELCKVLQQLVKVHEDELKYVRNQLSIHRAARAHHDQNNVQMQNLELMVPNFTLNDQELNHLPHFPQTNQERYQYTGGDSRNEYRRVKQEFMLDKKQPAVNDYQMDPILDEVVSAETNEFEFESEETVEHSGRDVLNEGRVISEENGAIQHVHVHVQDHDLEGAATLFPLTSCTSSEYNDPSHIS